MNRISWEKDSGERYQQIADNVLSPIYPWLIKDCCDILETSLKAKRVLEIGGGPGHMAAEFLSNSVDMLAELDISSYMLTKSQKHNKSTPLFIQGSACSIPIQSDYFDIVFSRGSVMFWENLDKAFSEISRVLKPGGKALIGGGYGMSTPNDIIETIKANHLNKSDIPKLDFAKLEAILVAKIGVSKIISKPSRGFWIKWTI